MVEVELTGGMNGTGCGMLGFTENFHMDGLLTLIVLAVATVIAVGWQILAARLKKRTGGQLDIDDLHGRSGCPALMLLLGLIWRPFIAQDSGFLFWLIVVLFFWGASGVSKRW